jgi:hypothetical protein
MESPKYQNSNHKSRNAKEETRPAQAGRGLAPINLKSQIPNFKSQS